MTRLAFFGELARIQIELKAESFEANSDAEPVIPADRLRRPLNFNVSPMTEIRCKQVRFFSKGDEELFFVWAQNIPEIKEVYGELDEIVLSLKSPNVEDDSLRELIALLYRFNLPLKQLAAFETLKNKEWFNNKHKFWYAGVFGENG